MHPHPSTPGRARNLPIAAMIAGVIAFAAACGGSGGGTTVGADGSDLLDWTRSASLTAAGNCDEATERLQEHAIVQMELNLEANRRCFVDPSSCWYRGGLGPESPPALGAPELDDSQGRDGPEDFSETNVQVDGVDEADRVKSDGTHLYVLSGQSLAILRAWPPQDLAESARVELNSWPSGMFLDGDRVVVLGYGHLPGDDPGNGPGEPPVPGRGVAEDAAIMPFPGFFRSYLTVTVVDVADRTAPRIVDEYFFDGDLVDSRRIGGQLYLAQNTQIWFPDLEYWPDLNFDEGHTEAEIDAAFDELHAQNVERIRARGLDDWLPRYWRVAADGTVSPQEGRPVSTCADVHSPSVFSGQNLLSLVTLDLDAGSVAGSTIQGAWGNVYASREAIYIGSTNWEFSWWWRPGGDAPSIQTHIHKFGFDGAGVARYAASGSVVGYALNQFSFDEHEGHLRVATTDGFAWWNDGETESRVTVLREDAGRLQQVGLVTGLGPDERIYSVRFLGDVGYVVTFFEVDPLYVIDLVDPTQPRVAGELKIPGFSSYIHPLADGFLLTAGRDGDDEGNVGGVKLEIFDVSDAADPRSVTTAVIGDGWNTWSEVLWDHRAFVFFRARNLLAIPVSGWSESPTPFGWGEYRSDLALFHVTTEAIEPLPSISHMRFIDELGGHAGCRGYTGYGQANIFRGVFADDFVYSLSTLGVQVHDTRAIEAGPLAGVVLADPNALGPFDWERCPRP